MRLDRAGLIIISRALYGAIRSALAARSLIYAAVPLTRQGKYLVTG